LLNEKILHQNYSISETLRETFFHNQVSLIHRVNQTEYADFEVNGKYIFEVGGAGKTHQQVKSLSNAFVVKDNVEFPVGDALPLWVFGFLY
jgi:uncharacterized protein